jgi:glycosyltransferase involved in cell wall biosynthesis
MRKMNVLFMQSQTYFGADSFIHSLLMRNLDRRAFNVYAAVNQGDAEHAPASLKALSELPDLQLRPTNFGSSVNLRSRSQIVRDTIGNAVPALRSMGGLVAYARKHKIDLVHCTEKPRDAFYGLLLARLSGAACIIHLHVGVDLGWMSPATQLAMRQADGLIAISAFVAKTAERAGLGLHKIHTVFNTLDANNWDYNLDPEIVRGEFGIPRDMPLLATVSRLTPWKGQTELLHALAKVKAQNPNFRLLLVGEDDFSATPGRYSYTAELKQITKALDLEEQVIFTGFRKDAKQIMAACDIYSMPSFEEPFGMVFLEAMAMKKPVIAIVSGGVPEFVDHGKAGLLSIHKDIDGLAANILTLVNDPELRRRMGEYGRRQVEETYHPAKMTREMEQVYHRVVAGRKGRRDQLAALPTTPPAELRAQEETLA